MSCSLLSRCLINFRDIIDELIFHCSSLDINEHMFDVYDLIEFNNVHHERDDMLEKYLMNHSEDIDDFASLFHAAWKNYCNDTCNIKTLEILLNYVNDPFTGYDFCKIINDIIWDSDYKNKYIKMDFLFDNLGFKVNCELLTEIFCKNNIYNSDKNKFDLLYFIRKIKVTDLMDTVKAVLLNKNFTNEFKYDFKKLVVENYTSDILDLYLQN